MSTKLQFDQTHSLIVQEDASDVEAAFMTVTPNPAAMVPLTHNGRRVLVNVATVRYFMDTEG